MYRSFLKAYKHIGVYSDGCLSLNCIDLNILKRNKKLFIYKKDYKLFRKLLKNKSSVKKTNKYRNKIF